ncbi:uncharacterized protein TRAVEDRAFT_21774 [Trametes versicolor FP-101664 SS1]|uniref:uncharacterized protein n=1 Tax=Trametes versicolor (strain FP-101664) TaxID=717944 RepID=UPI0004624877|nr:uncharacterized protein TRAVEDRAFT_21774 [Trametes versicolor FP-101664 SS1]EIW56693.1 hypothetical protein TRAVEDRAFT_21774 [Trametes versicolor FP-101664 SS1]
MATTDPIRAVRGAPLPLPLPHARWGARRTFRQKDGCSIALATLGVETGKARSREKARRRGGGGRARHASGRAGWLVATWSGSKVYGSFGGMPVRPRSPSSRSTVVANPKSQTMEQRSAILREQDTAAEICAEAGEDRIRIPVRLAV